MGSCCCGCCKNFVLLVVLRLLLLKLVDSNSCRCGCWYLLPIHSPERIRRGRPASHAPLAIRLVLFGLSSVVLPLCTLLLLLSLSTVFVVAVPGGTPLLLLLLLLMLLLLLFGSVHVGEKRSWHVWYYCARQLLWQMTAGSCLGEPSCQPTKFSSTPSLWLLLIMVSATTTLSIAAHFLRIFPKWQAFSTASTSFIHSFIQSVWWSRLLIVLGCVHFLIARCRCCCLLFGDKLSGSILGWQRAPSSKTIVGTYRLDCRQVSVFPPPSLLTAATQQNRTSMDWCLFSSFPVSTANVVAAWHHGYTHWIATTPPTKNACKFFSMIALSFWCFVAVLRFCHNALLPLLFLVVWSWGWGSKIRNNCVQGGNDDDGCVVCFYDFAGAASDTRCLQHHHRR